MDYIPMPIPPPSPFSSGASAITASVAKIMRAMTLSVELHRAVFVYLRPPAVAVDHPNVHDAGTASAVGLIVSGVRLFWVSRPLKPTRSTLSIAFHAFADAVNSLQPASQVSTSALVGGMSMPFCESGPRTVL